LTEKYEEKIEVTFFELSFFEVFRVCQDYGACKPCQWETASLQYILLSINTPYYGLHQLKRSDRAAISSKSERSVTANASSAQTASLAIL